MSEGVENLEVEIDSASSYLAEVVENLAAGRKASKNRKIIKIGNTLLTKYDSYNHQLGEEVYNTFDAVMRTAKYYGEKEAQKVAASSVYDISPLIDIMEADAKKIGCENLKIYEIYERVKSQDTVLARLFGEMAPNNEVMGAWNECKGDKKEETLLSGDLSRQFYDFKIGIMQKKRGKNSTMSLPWIGLIYSLFSSQPFVTAPQTILYLSAFNLGREGLRRFVLENPKKMRPRLEFIDEKIKQRLPRPIKNMQETMIKKLNLIEARKKTMKELDGKIKNYKKLEKGDKESPEERAKILGSLKTFDAEKRMEEYQNVLYSEGMAGWTVGKMIEGVDSFERKLNRVGFSIPYLMILGGEALYFQFLGAGLSPMLARLPSLLMWTYGVPLVMYGGKKIKTGKNKLKAYINAMTKMKKSEGKYFQRLKENAKKYEDAYTAKGYLEEPPDPSKQGKMKKIDRLISTFKFPLGKDRHFKFKLPSPNIGLDLKITVRNRPFGFKIPPEGKYIDFKIPLGDKYISLLEYPFVFRKRSEEDLKKVNELLVEGLKKDYDPAVVEILEKYYISCITLGEGPLNRAIGIKPTVSSVVVYEHKERARKLGETEYHLGDPRFMKPVVEEMVKRRRSAGKSILVKKKINGSLVEEEYAPNIFDYRDDYQILALSDGYEELIFGSKYERKRVKKKSPVVRMGSKIGEISEKAADRIPVMKGPLGIVEPTLKKLSERLFYKDGVECLYSEGSAILNFENAVRRGLITQIPRFVPRTIETEKGKCMLYDVVYDLEEYQIYSTDLNTQPGLFADIDHEVRHVANSLEMWENTKKLGKIVLRKLAGKPPTS